MNQPVRIGVVTNLSKPDAVSRTRELLGKLRHHPNVSVVVESATASACAEPKGLAALELAAETDLILVLGGDGTMLGIARQLGRHVRPLVGLNLGRLGFLTTATEEHLDELVDALVHEKYKLSQRRLIQVDFVTSNGESHRLCGLNEVTIGRGASSKLIRLQVTINGAYLNCYNGDGLIIATPTGSTAYSLSAGGPLVSPEARVFLITPICSHALASRAFVTEDSAEIIVKTDGGPREQMLLTVDGGEPYELHPDREVHLHQANYTLPLVHLQGATFYHVLQEKLKWMGSSV